MRLIVNSRVFKYKALILGTALLSLVAFFQSNQPVKNTPQPNNLTKEESSEIEQTEPSSDVETPPKTPDSADKPEKPDSPGASSSKTRIHIKINTNSTGGETNNSVDISTEPPIPLEQILKDARRGNFEINLETKGGGKAHVKFHSSIKN